jgi:hypothetical protein
MSEDKLIDKRYLWSYKGCEIIPVACHRYANWGKEAKEIDFGHGSKSRYWRIEFPDKSWVHAETKEECRKYIRKMEENSWHGLRKEKLQ